jgi:CubicO group peptidase (beta-lactamase class C family)
VTIRIIASAALAILAWIGLATYAALAGWWRVALAAPGDVDGFGDAAVREIRAGRPGNAVIALIQNGEIVFRHSQSIDAPVGADTLFQLASVSKWVTAWGVLALVEDGRLALDAPVADYLSRWTLPKSEHDNNHVTVRRLLSHSAGLTDGLGYYGFPPGEPVQTLEDSLTHAADAYPKDHPPDSVGPERGHVRLGAPIDGTMRYSGGGYTLLQLLIEEVTGRDFADYMREQVLEPLGMHRSTFDWQEAEVLGLATFYTRGHTQAHHYRYTALAAASLYSSVHDMSRFVQAHFEGPSGELPGRGVISADMLAAMESPQSTARYLLVERPWGLGAAIYGGDGERGSIIGHDGGNYPAINTAIRANRHTRSGFVMFETGAEQALATRMAGEWTYWSVGAVELALLTMELATLTMIVVAGCLVILIAVVFRYLRTDRRAF